MGTWGLFHNLTHCEGKGNDWAERLAGKATFKSGLLLGRSEVLRNLRTTCGVQSQGLHTIDRLEERSVERGSAGRCSLKGRERAIVNQTNIGTVPKATLGKRLRDELEHIWAFPSAYIPSWTELNWHIETRLYARISVHFIKMFWAECRPTLQG